MTNKEAIELLKPLTEWSVNKNGIGTFPLVSTHSQVEALDLAIKALEEKPQGEWIIIDDVYCGCPFCKNKEVKFSKHCPECGARLKGGME